MEKMFISGIVIGLIAGSILTFWGTILRYNLSKKEKLKGPEMTGKVFPPFEEDEYDTFYPDRKT